MRLIASATALMGLLVVSSPAHAVRHWDNVDARPILEFYLSIQGNGVFTFETDDLKASSVACPNAADTRMVVQAPDGNFYHGDNGVSGSLRSRLLIFHPSGGMWKFWVFAASTPACGRADVHFTVPGGTRAKVGNDLEFGGTTVTPTGLSSGLTYRYQTSHNPGGADDTMLMLFTSTWAMKDWSHDEGIGLAARFQEPAATKDKLVIGSTSWASSGSTAAFADSCLYTPDDSLTNATACFNNGYDGDRDNLSNGLESELGTDLDRWDSDGDGLFDYHEVIGRITVTGDEEMRRYGANPLLPDVFVEVDTRWFVPNNGECGDPFGGEDFAPSKVLEAAAVFLASGIHLHVDNDQPCSATPTTCGDWGGSQRFGRVPDVGAPGPDGELQTYFRSETSAQINAHGGFRNRRHGLFRYALRWHEFSATCGNQTGAGQASNMSFYFSGSRGVFQHELGHTLGLTHYGAPGGVSMNHKINYPSIMSYLFQNNPAARFSDGLLAAIDHRNMSETSWSPGADKSHLADTNIELEVCPSALACPAAAQPADAVDWNMDGRYTNGGVRFDVSPRNNAGGTAGWPLATGATTIFETGIPVSGPAMATIGETVYLFRVTSAGVLRFNKLTDGAWSGWQNLTVSFSLSPTGDTAAVFMPASLWLVDRIVIVHPQASTGKLGYAFFSPATESITASNLFTGWPAGASTRVATIAKVGNQAMVGFRDDAGSPAGQVWLTAAGAGLTWSAFSLASTAVKDILSLAAPGMAESPDGNVYLAVVNASTNGAIDFLRRPIASTGQWELLDEPSGQVMGYDIFGGITTRLNMTFMPYLTGAGVPFADGTGYLALFYNALSETGGNRWARAYTRGHVGPGGASFSDIPTHRRQQYVVPNHVRGRSLAAARRGNQAAVAYNKEPSGQDLLYLPYANGTPPNAVAGHVDNDDAATMNQNNCSRLWSTFCSARCSVLDNPYAVSCSPSLPFDSGECVEP